MTFIVLLVGLGVGVLVGLLGVGGGVVLVPAMVYLPGMDQHLSLGTSLFILLPPIGLGALREYWKQGRVDLRAGILCALGMLVGAYGGSLLALPIPSRHGQGLFGCFFGSLRDPAVEEIATRAKEDGCGKGACSGLRAWGRTRGFSWWRVSAG